MTNFEDVLAAWQDPNSAERIHPTRRISEEAYWASGMPQAKQVADAISDVLGGVVKGARVIDFGAGDGRVAIPMFELGMKVLAVDASREALDRLTEREPGIATYVSDGSDLTAFSDDHEAHLADALVCRAVLIHHSYKDVTRLVAEFAKVVKPGGLLIADWPTSERPEERTDWIGVTTWDRSVRDEVADRLGWEPVNADGDPGVWRRKIDEDVTQEPVVEKTAEPTTKEIREWAVANGHDVSTRGKIPADIVEAYAAAHRTDDIL